MGKKKKKKNNITLDKVIIDDTKGVSISYHTEDVKKNLPYLFNELKNSEQKIGIEGVEKPSTNIEKPDELYNPGLIDFIRRCNTEKEVYEILDFFLERKEISDKEYKEFKKRIKAEGIGCFGEKKTWGYFERKYRNLK